MDIFQTWQPAGDWPDKAEFMAWFDDYHGLWRLGEDVPDAAADHWFKSVWLRDETNAAWYYGRLEVVRAAFELCQSRHEAVLAQKAVELTAAKEQALIMARAKDSWMGKFTELKQSCLRLIHVGPKKSVKAVKAALAELIKA